MAIVLALIAKPLLQMFSNDPAVIDLAAPYFYLIPVTVFAYGFVFVTAAGFNALGRPVYGFVFTVVRSLLLYAPLTALGAYSHGLIGAFVGIAVSNIVSGFIARWWALNRAP